MQKTITVMTPDPSPDYELIDSGNEAKLERFGTYVISRPDPRAIWTPRAPEDIWQKADAHYVRSSREDGQWSVRKPAPPDWQVSFGPLTFSLRPTSFKHVGVFPEQAANWSWLSETIGGKPLSILNLFAYTGGATMAAAAAGASVTHVDSAKGTVEWARHNAALSGLSEAPIRWIVDDALGFVKREARRGHTYDGIILDPPRFGRGAKGEVWKLEDGLPALLAACVEILKPHPTLLLLNAYTADLSSLVLAHLMDDLFSGRGGTTEWGELAIADTTSGRLLPHGVFARWANR